MNQKQKLILGIGSVAAVAAVIGIVAATQKKPPAVDTSLEMGTETVAVSETAETETMTEFEFEMPDSENVIPSYKPVPLSVQKVTMQEYSEKQEAEELEFSGDLKVVSGMEGYSGSGYLTGFDKNKENKAEATFTLPSSQHYDITISVSADKEVTNTLMMNGKKLGDFQITQPGKFIRVTFSGIYLPEGSVVLSLAEKDGGVNLDYYEITNFSELYDLKYDEKDDLCDAEASDAAKALMAELKSNYGKKIYTGQYASSPENLELETIYHMTGKYPAIRFGVLDAATAEAEVKASAEWAERGGIVGLMWYWESPSAKKSVFQKESDFSLKTAMTTVDIANMSLEDIRLLEESKEISPECLAIVEDLDAMAETLKPLADADIAVLWRPLHEAGGNWFWWGSNGPEAYKWLWNLMYTRMTQYHGIHNLIWMWNGQDEKYLVNAGQYDIASLDIYASKDADYGSRYQEFVVLNRLTQGKKLLALSETSSLLNLNEVFRDNSIWSFSGLWYGEYLMDENGKFSGTYFSSKTLADFYNSEAVITCGESAANRRR